MGICGRITSDGIESSAVSRTLSAISIGSARHHRHWAGPNARLASCDEGSLASNVSGFVALFDGHIHNRNELDKLLNRKDFARPNNAQFALLCYEQWGDDFCDRMIGDFACAIWDAGQRRLIMAVDPGTPRPLFYWSAQSQLLFASEPRGLWSDPDVPKTLDEDEVAAWLCLLPCAPERSFFRNIFRVPPGSRLIWQNGRVRTERWWHPERLPELKLSSDHDYEERLRSCLDEAVRCRLGSDELIGSHLSGGIDSSVVTATAARLLADQGRRLAAFTATASHPAPEERIRFNDEWPYASATAAMYPNIDHIRIANDDAPLLDALERREAGQDWPVMNPFNTVWMSGIDRAAQDRRVSILLTGQMGNMTISYDGGELLASQFQRADIFGAFKTVWDLHRFGGRSWQGMVWDTASATLPRRVWRKILRFIGRPEPELFDFSLAKSDFIRSARVERRARHVAGNLKNLTRNSRALRLLVLERADRSHWASTTRRLFGIDTRDPTSDRRLIELCLMIPDTQYLHKGVYRSLIRRAMAGRVPAQVLQERRKGRQASDWRFGFDAAMPQFASELVSLQSSRLARQCLDLKRMQKLLENWPGPNKPELATANHYLLAVSRGIAAGHFIRKVEGSNR